MCRLAVTDPRDEPVFDRRAGREAPPAPAAAILAGGRATRFEGRDKSALTFGAERFLDRQIAALEQVADDVLIVTNQPDRYRSLGVRVVVDAVEGAGALGGIYTALVASSAAQVLVVACDMPFLTAAFLAHLARAGRDVDIAIPRTAAGYEPLCASYARTCLAPIKARLDGGRLKVVDLVEAGLRVRELGTAELARFDPDAALFFNVNTPADYDLAVRKFKRQNE
jgi:molybdopterin-guanine dinucleotide biosynthesis protein A